MNNNYFNIFTSISEASLVLKAVLLILFILSVYCWGVIINKFRIITKYTSLTKKLRISYQKNSEDYNIEKLFLKYKKNPYLPVLNFLNINKPYLIKQNNLNSILVDKIYSFLYDINSSLENRLTSLATIGAIAPFIGLFGTVVGIINSFSSIGSNSSASLAIIAPGIAEALYATAFGLFVAVPAVFAYNILNNKLENYKLEQDMLLQNMVFYALKTTLVNNVKENDNELEAENRVTSFETPKTPKKNSLNLLQEEHKALRKHNK